MIQHGVSIIICCHNGASRLPETIKHIQNQVVPRHIPWEFILVDNASTDNTIDIAEQVWSERYCSGEFRLVSEPVLGLSHARKRGFEEAQYDFMIMCDDDNWLASDYVTNTYYLMVEKNSVGALGGFGKLIFECDPPKWIENAQIFAAGSQSEHSGKVEKNRLYGAGCVIRKTAYLKLMRLGFKSFLSDRKGNELSSGGDYELCYALAILGYDIWYDERLRFSHFITKERLTWEYFMRYARESSRCFDVLTSYKMIAADSRTHKFSFLVMSKDFFFCCRKFMSINTNRLVTIPSSNSGRILYFRHVIFKYKLIAYFRKFTAIVKNHEQILRFKEACTTAQASRKEEQVFATPQYRLTFSSKPFQRL